MKKILLTFILVFILAGNACAVCCPAPNCLDGTESFFSCGAGKSYPFFPGGCFFLTMCGCPKCREAKNIDECFLFCKHQKVSEEAICYGEPMAEDICMEKASRDFDNCNDVCENKFP